jgi:hypothetical protein
MWEMRLHEEEDKKNRGKGKKNKGRGKMSIGRMTVEPTADEWDPPLILPTVLKTSFIIRNYL